MPVLVNAVLVASSVTVTIPVEEVVTEVNTGKFVVLFKPLELNPALPDTAIVANFDIVVPENVSLVALPATVNAVTLPQPLENVVVAVAVEERPDPVKVILTAVYSALVSINVKPVTEPVVKFNVLAPGFAKLLVMFKVAVPEAVTVKLLKAFEVIVEFTAFGSKPNPAKVTEDIVPAVDVLEPLESVIFTIPSKIPPVAAVTVGTTVVALPPINGNV